MQKSNAVYTIYTDGGSRGNPGIGAWAAVIYKHKEEIDGLQGAEKLTTNNRMELSGAIAGLKYVRDHLAQSPTVEIITDSTYVRDGITKWILNWKKNGWKTAAKKPVKNADLWQELDALHMEIDPVWKWVKGHAGNVGNERADELCNSAMDALEE